MRAKTLLKKLLGMKHLEVVEFSIERGGLVVAVRPTWRRPRCSGCLRVRPGYDQLAERSWRHLDFGGVQISLVYGRRRVDCPECGVVVEQVPWSETADGRFTTDFEDAVAYLVQRTDKTSVTEMFHIAWRSVGQIVKRVVGRQGLKEALDGLEYIGVDELSYRKGHRYLTLVTDLETRRIIWAKEGKNADTLKAFFDELGTERCNAIDTVSMDMSQAFISAVRDKLPDAQIVFDRFHVQQLVSGALDRTRREEWQRVRKLDAEEGKAVKGLRWPLLKRAWNLTPAQAERLSTLQQDNRRLYRAYLLKESFADILDGRQPGVVKTKLLGWLGWASRSRLPAFVTVARTIRGHLDDIVAYVRWRLSNGPVEGLNNKARLLTRRAYGFHSAAAAIAMIMLCCTGIDLEPPSKVLTS